MQCQSNESCIREVHLSGTVSMEIAFEHSTLNPMVMIMYTFNTAYMYLTIDKNRHATIDINLALISMYSNSFVFYFEQFIVQHISNSDTTDSHN